MSILWQAVAVAGHADAFPMASPATHELLHWQQKAHHHHDDGQVTQDSSQESLQHVAIDGSVHAIALPSSLPAAAILIVPTQAPAFGRINVPWPHIDALKRPPRSLL